MNPLSSAFSFSLMIESLPWFAVSLALGSAGVWWARSFAIRQHWLDQPNERSFHHQPTPRIGGIGVLLPVILGLVLIAVLPQWSLPLSYWVILAPALMISMLSFFDDRFDLSRAIRFSIHLLLAGIVLWELGSGWMGGSLPLVGGLLPDWMLAVVLAIWIVGLTNAYNFMDGIDGIAAVQGILATAGWLLLILVDPVLGASIPVTGTWILLALLGGLCGFLVFNWPPASIFLGDLGSTFLGFFLAALPIALSVEGLPLETALEAGALMVWPFVVDTGTAFVRRLVLREPVFDAHRSHLYQTLAGTFATRDPGHRPLLDRRPPLGKTRGPDRCLGGPGGMDLRYSDQGS